MKKFILIALMFVSITFANAQIKENVNYKIINKSGRALNIEKQSVSSGANVNIWDKGNYKSQIFNFIKAPDGFWYIKNVGSGMAIDVEKGVQKRGTNVQQYQINLTVSQRFQIVGAKDGYVYIKTSEGYCLSSETIHGQKGSNVILWSENNVARWKIVKEK